VTAFGRMRLVIGIRPFFYFGVLVAFLGCALLAYRLGRKAELHLERNPGESGTLTVVRFDLLGRSDSMAIDFSRIEDFDICEDGPTSMVPAIREGRKSLFCSLMITLRDTLPVPVGAWMPFPFQQSSQLLALRDSLSGFVHSPGFGQINVTVGGFEGAMATAGLALGICLLLLRLFSITTLLISVRAEAAGASVVTRLKRPGFQPAETEVHYVPMGWVTSVRPGQSGGIVVEYSNGPEVRIPLPEMSDRLLVRVRLFLEDTIMTHVRTARGN
jgi:hypothetical protein